MTTTSWKQTPLALPAFLTGMRHHHPCPTTCSKLFTQNFGTRMFEGANLADITDKVRTVHDPGDLLHLREILFEEFSPPLTWLVKLSGLYLSEASVHEKDYREFIAHIDDCHEITLDKVQHVSSSTLALGIPLPVLSPGTLATTTSCATTDAPAVATLVVTHPSLLGPPAAPAALALAALFRTRKSPLKRSSTGKIRVSTKSTASLPPLSTATTWHPSKFSLTLHATVFSTKKLAALSQPPLTSSCFLPTPTATMTDGLFLSLFYVLLVGACTDISMWRDVFPPRACLA
jgi:hypothetical protein